MAKLGVSSKQPQEGMGDDNDYVNYLALFEGPLSESKREAIRALFPAGCAIDGIQLAEGVDLEI
jgi:hypothetical protein